MLHTLVGLVALLHKYSLPCKLVGVMGVNVHCALYFTLFNFLEKFKQICMIK